MQSLRRAIMLVTGTGLGSATALIEMAYVVFAGLTYAVPAARAPICAGAYRLADVERRRLALFVEASGSADYPSTRALRYLALRWPVGLLGAGVLAIMAVGTVTGVIMLGQLLAGQGLGGAAPLAWYHPLIYLLAGVLLVFITVQGLLGAAALDRRLANRLLAPSMTEQLRRRVSELSTSRAEVVAAVNDERRRIERALHDGVQQQLVALGMVLGRAQRVMDPQQTSQLLLQAHTQAQQSLRDLREVTWRVYPVALDEGLHTALEALAEHCGMPVVLRYALAERPSTALEVIAYFVVSEALTNTVKHSGASQAIVEITDDGTNIAVRVTDDGNGGAVAGGSGLSGLARRVAAEDGALDVDSPPGGPTVVTATLPREEQPCG